jgi:hypothetical protein
MRATTVAPEDLTAGVQIKSMQLNGKLLDSKKQSIKGTNMNVQGLTIKPHEQTHFDITYSLFIK